MVTLLILTNGRKEYLEKTLESLYKLQGQITRKIIHDDSGDVEYQRWLETLGFETCFTNRVGFSKAMISAWEQMKQDVNEFVFHLEDDFVFLEEIKLNDMIKVLREQNLVQLVLLRQPIGQRERKKGSIIASHPERYEEKTDGENFWVEHRVNFSCNPTLYQKSLIHQYPWPDVPYSERRYGEKLFSDSEKRCAYWGKRDDTPKVYHIGDIRAGFGY